MEPSFADLIQSDLFTFYVGEERKPFVVHSKAIASTSQPFRALVSGDLAEARTRSAEIKDIEPEDFVRFLEYAYRRDYTVPAWNLTNATNAASKEEEQNDSPGYAEVVKELPLPPEPEPSAHSDIDIPTEDHVAAFGSIWASSTSKQGFNSFGTSAKASKKSSSKKLLGTAKLRSRLQRRDYLEDGIPNTTINAGFEPQPKSAADQDLHIKPKFLAHARLYTFAEMRLIDPLKQLALYKLHKTLMSFKLHDQRIGDIVALVEHAYSNGANRADSGDMDKLRNLVVEYVAGEVDTIGKHESFRNLLEEGGEFVSDFWQVVDKYLL